MSEHTATPWKVMTGHPSRGLFVVGPPDDHGYTPEVCEVDKAENMDANAAFIVRAVNSHAALVAALRAVEWVRGVGQGEWCYVCMHQRGKGHAPDCQLDAALRAAEGE